MTEENLSSIVINLELLSQFKCKVPDGKDVSLCVKYFLTEFF